MNKLILVLVVLLLMIGSALTGNFVFKKLFIKNKHKENTSILHKINAYDYTQKVCEVVYLSSENE